MKKTELENLRKNKISELIALKSQVEDEMLKIAAKSISKDAKTTKELKTLRGKISRIETVISEMSYQKLTLGETDGKN